MPKILVVQQAQTVLSNGNTGIRVTTPAQKLHVVGNTYLNESLGIGVSNPSAKLQLGDMWEFHPGNAGFGDKHIFVNLYYNGSNWVRMNTGIASRLSFAGSGYMVLSTAASGNANTAPTWNSLTLKNDGVVVAKSFSTSSDAILKTDIQPIKNAADILKQIKTYSYYFKADPVETRERNFGVLAQEVETVLPELVSITKVDDIEIKSVNYDDFISKLSQPVLFQYGNFTLSARNSLSSRPVYL